MATFPVPRSCKRKRISEATEYFASCPIIGLLLEQARNEKTHEPLRGSNRCLIAFFFASGSSWFLAVSCHFSGDRIEKPSQCRTDPGCRAHPRFGLCWRWIPILVGGIDRNRRCFRLPANIERVPAPIGRKSTMRTHVVRFPRGRALISCAFGAMPN